MMNKTILSGIGVVLFLFLLLGCGGTTQTAGGSSDTELVGYIYTTAGLPAYNVEVTLHRNLSGASDTILAIDTTDTTGQYSFTEVPEGEFTIYAVDSLGEQSVQFDLIVSDTTSPDIDTQTIDISGSLSVTTTIDARYYGGTIMLEGSPLSAPFGPGEEMVTISGLPAGEIYTVTSISNGMGMYTYSVPAIIDAGIFSFVEQYINVLFICDTSVANRSIELESLLSSPQIMVNRKSIQDITPSDISSAEIIYIGAEVDTLLGVTAALKEAVKPIVIASSDLYSDFGLALEVSIGTESAEDLIVIESTPPFFDSLVPTSSISLFENQSVAIVEWGTSIVGFSFGRSGGIETDRIYYFICEPSTPLLDSSVAFGYRIGMVGSSNELLNSDGLTILQRTLLWAVEKNSQY